MSALPIHFDIMFKKLKKSGDLKPESGDREKCSNVLKIREISRIFGRFGTSGMIHTTKLNVDLLKNLIDMFMEYLCVHHVVK